MEKRDERFMKSGNLKEIYGQYEIPEEIHLLFQLENAL